MRVATPLIAYASVAIMRYCKRGTFSAVRTAECTTTAGRKQSELNAAARNIGAAPLQPKLNNVYPPNAPTFHANPSNPVNRANLLEFARDVSTIHSNIT